MTPSHSTDLPHRTNSERWCKLFVMRVSAHWLTGQRWGECWSAVIYHNSVKDLLQPISVSWSEERKGEMNEWGNEIDWTHHQSGCISHVNFTIKIIGQWTGHPISAVFPIESFILFFYHLDQVRPVAAWSYLLLSTNNWLPTIIDHWSVLVLLSSLLSPALPSWAFLPLLCNKFSPGRAVEGQGQTKERNGSSLSLSSSM